MSGAHPLSQNVDGADREQASTRDETPLQALVRVAVALRASERRAIRERLERYFGRPLELIVEQDPSILGGVWARVGDVVLDGSLRGCLEALRHHLRSQSRAMISADLRISGVRASERDHRHMR